ncbi:MAG: WD40 repeat domain-containing protein, partial [Coleofasciculus sp. C2-GNP5-27]
DETLKIWDLQSGEELKTLTEHSDSVHAVAISSSGRRAVSASADNTLKVWDLHSGQELKTLRGHINWVWSVAITPDRKRAVSASWDTSLIVWNLQSGIPRKMLLAHTDSVESVAITPNGQWAVSTSRDKFLILWDLHRDEIITTFKGDGELLCCAVAPDGLTIVAGEASGRVHFLRLENSSAFGSECNG